MYHPSNCSFLEPKHVAYDKNTKKEKKILLIVSVTDVHHCITFKSQRRDPTCENINKNFIFETAHKT